MTYIEIGKTLTQQIKGSTGSLGFSRLYFPWAGLKCARAGLFLVVRSLRVFVVLLKSRLCWNLQTQFLNCYRWVFSEEAFYLCALVFCLMRSNDWPLLFKGWCAWLGYGALTVQLY